MLYRERRAVFSFLGHNHADVVRVPSILPGTRVVVLLAGFTMIGAAKVAHNIGRYYLPLEDSSFDISCELPFY